jgi:hypothetical protein
MIGSRTKDVLTSRARILAEIECADGLFIAP